jgi:DNA-binding CsgD family transcriptional regulator
MNVISASPRIERELPLDALMKSLAPRCRECTSSGKVLFQAYDDETVLRLIPLSGKLAGSVAIFVDLFGRRGSVSAAAKTFGLTKRETDVLQLVLRAASNANIAQRLCIAESTVSDHVKHLMRKMNTTKRMEIIGRVFDLDRSGGLD